MDEGRQEHDAHVYFGLFCGSGWGEKELGEESFVVEVGAELGFVAVGCEEGVRL
jgi:hypothetical protein